MSLRWQKTIFYFLVASDAQICFLIAKKLKTKIILKNSTIGIITASGHNEYNKMCVCVWKVHKNTNISFEEHSWSKTHTHTHLLPRRWCMDTQSELRCFAKTYIFLCSQGHR